METIIQLVTREETEEKNEPSVRNRGQKQACKEARIREMRRAHLKDLRWTVKHVLKKISMCDRLAAQCGLFEKVEKMTSGLNVVIVIHEDHTLTSRDCQANHRYKQPATELIIM